MYMSNELNYLPSLRDKLHEYVQDINHLENEWHRHIIEAYIHLRKTNCNIPDEVLDFIKESALAALKLKSDSGNNEPKK